MILVNILLGKKMKLVEEETGLCDSQYSTTTCYSTINTRGPNFGEISSEIKGRI